MNKSIKEQLEQAWCNVKPIDIEEPVLKHTDFEFNASNDINPMKDSLKLNKDLK